ncbi:MAG: 2-oxo acid dehydrogenase subunit E2 [Planctomycetes bacterium]|nr:2-oxo acid dehydrogenase subunit E2 [Planctomycetota bacterium]
MEFNLPDIGEGVAEGEVVKWLVKEGDTVVEDQPIVEVMTDKATVQIPSPAAGVIQRLAAKEGEIVPVGKALVVIATTGGAAPAAAHAPVAAAAHASAATHATPVAAHASATAQAAPAHAAPVHVTLNASAAGHPELAGAAARPVAAVAPAASPVHATAGVAVAVAPQRSVDSKVLATPATRRLAQELGIELASLAGTGPHGRVTREDVLRHSPASRAASPEPVAAAAGAHPASPAHAPAPALAAHQENRPSTTSPATPRPSAPASTGAVEERIPFRGIRRKIAERMVQSKRTAAHFTYVDEVDMTRLVALRNEAKEIAEKRGVKLSYLPFIVKALIAGLREYPLLNSTIDEAASELVLKKYYHIGIATDTSEGLLVPVLKDADRRSILDLGREIERLAANARAGKSELADLQGGTFTITSAGNIGGLFATPIINYPEVAILGVHQIKQKPVVRDGQLAIGSVMYLSLSLDHRVVDGAMGARFMNTVIGYLQEPQLLLLEST